MELWILPGADLLLNTGPINMKLKDTIETVLAIVGGLGTNHLSSIYENIILKGQF